MVIEIDFENDTVTEIYEKIGGMTKIQLIGLCKFLAQKYKQAIKHHLFKNKITDEQS